MDGEVSGTGDNGIVDPPSGTGPGDEGGEPGIVDRESGSGTDSTSSGVTFWTRSGMVVAGAGRRVVKGATGTVE